MYCTFVLEDLLFLLLLGEGKLGQGGIGRLGGRLEGDYFLVGLLQEGLGLGARECFGFFVETVCEG